VTNTQRTMKTLLFTSLLLRVLVVDASKASDGALRSEFIRRMDEALVNNQKQDDLTARLLKVARPAPAATAPEFMQARVLEEYQDYGVNLTSYALKYVGCSNINTYSDDLAEDEDSDTVLEMNRFVVVRLCPRELCSNYNDYGCNAGFGDYLINMEQYLQTMAESYYAQYQEYCETCYSCMHQNNGNNSAAADDAYYADADDGDDYNRRRLADDYYNANDGDDGDDQANACEYYDVCENYRTACKDYAQQADDMQDFFECGQFNVGNNVAYMGPHCRSDGKTIGIGIYKDEYCNKYNAALATSVTTQAWISPTNI
jgi:hypothetical protein